MSAPALLKQSGARLPRMERGKMRKPRPAIDRFWEKVDRNGSVPQYRPALGPCWLWTGSLNDSGYGVFRHVRDNGQRGQRAHRFAYEFFVRQIPDGLVIDHLCRNPICVNPSHLEAVTNRENVVRGIGPRLSAERSANQTHCKHGHEFTPENTKIRTRPSGGRECRICSRAWTLTYTRRIRKSGESSP